MANSPLAGKPAPESALDRRPEARPCVPRGAPRPREPGRARVLRHQRPPRQRLRRTFNEDHIVAITHAICDYRARQGIDGPLFLGKDTHALSEPASRVALRVPRGARGRRAHRRGRLVHPDAGRLARRHRRQPRPRTTHLADGIVVTPSHNPPEDGGLQVRPAARRPGRRRRDARGSRRAPTSSCGRASAKLARVPYERALRDGLVRTHDYVTPYVDDLGSVIDLEVVARSGIRLGADAMGGASVHYWGRIAERYGLNLEVVRPGSIPRSGSSLSTTTGRSAPIALRRTPWPTCSPSGIASISRSATTPTPIAMASSLAPAVWSRPTTSSRSAPTTSSGRAGGPSARRWARRSCRARSSIASRARGAALSSRCRSASSGSSAGSPTGRWASPARRARGHRSSGATGASGPPTRTASSSTCSARRSSPGRRRILPAYYADLEAKLGSSSYTRVDEPASAAQRARIKAITPEDIGETTLAGNPIIARLSKAPGNGAPIGGLKVTTASGWFAIRPSGTEDVYKLYAESLRDRAHLDAIVEQARAIVARLIA